jgi:photosystem II stability/assembly factor-like uncharacterized protein
MKKLIIALTILILSACGTLPGAPSQPVATPIPTDLPDLQATGTAQVYASWTEMYQTLTAQPPQDTSAPTATSVPATQPTPQPGSSLLLSQLNMIDVNNGWALVSAKDSSRWHVLRTTDGSLSWHDVTPPQVITLSERGAWFFGSLAALDNKTAWAIADGDSTDDGTLFGVIWQTEDGGQSWRPGNPIPIFTPNPETWISGYETWLRFVDARHGWLRARVHGAMGHYVDVWFHTSDGGLTWESLSSGCTDWTLVCEYLFVDGNTGFNSVKDYNETQLLPIDQIGNSPTWQIEKTTDAGHDWTKTELPPIPDLRKNLFEGQAYTASQISTFQITINKHIQGFSPGVIGIRMDFSVLPPGSFATQPLFVKSYQYLSADKGLTWRIIPFSGALFFLDDTTGWGLSEQDGNYSIEKTSDGGATWQTIRDAAFPGTGTLLFKDANTGWAIINQPDYTQRLMRTTDSGQTWMEISQNLLDTLETTIASSLGPTQLGALAALPEEPWNARMEVGAHLVLNTIHMSDATNGWGTSLNGYIFHTADGGRTWQDVTPRYGTVTSQRSFSALDATHAWTTVTPLPACITDNLAQSCPEYYSTNGPVWDTNDGGQTWRPLGIFRETNRPKAWTSVNIHFTSETLGWADWLNFDPNGDHSSYNVAGTTDGGLTWGAPQTGPYTENRSILFLDQQLGFRTRGNFSNFLTLDKLINGEIPITIDKTMDEGNTWEQVTLPKFMISTDEIDLYEGVSPVSLDQLSTDKVDCNNPELISFGQQSLGLKYACSFLEFTGHFFEYYYSPDGGQSWHNWMSSGNEFFLANRTGWRLNSAGSTQLSLLLHTNDGGATWTTIKTVGWQEAHFDFVDQQTGWALVTSQDTTALVHTIDGGQTWEEIKPVVANR